jgi:hypothetical protein
MQMKSGRQRLLFIATVCIAAPLLLVSLNISSFDSRWRSLNDGMTESQVRQVLGNPNLVGTSGCMVAGGREAIRWEYKRTLAAHVDYYYVDFDYLGAGGAPVVFRTEREQMEWSWGSLLPSWWPWQPPKVRA